MSVAPHPHPDPGPHPGPGPGPHPGPALPRERLAWTSDAARRVRTPSAWRSRGVFSLKLLLPALGVGLVVLLLSWPEGGGEDRFARRLSTKRFSAADAESLTMHDARYNGVDDQKRPFVVTARTATQENAAADRVDLAEPKADMTQPNGVWIAGSSRTGVYGRASRVLDLAGDVLLYQDDGTEFRTSRARIKLADSSAEGVDPVDGQGPTMIVKAESGFRIHDRGARIEFLGRAQVIIAEQLVDGGRSGQNPGEGSPQR